MKKFTLFVLALLTLSTIGAKAETAATPELPEGVITCAEAVAICEQTGSTLTAEAYTVRGYITSIKYTWSEQYGTATFWIADTKDGGQVLQAYSCAPLTDADKVFAVGDYVELVGKLKKYNTTNEVEKGTYTVITAAEGGETPEEPETPIEPEEPETPEEKPLTDGYTKVTNISALATGDKVVLYCDAYAVGVAGFDGNKSGVMAETGWVEYVVETVEGGILLKDETAGKYAALLDRNSFHYADQGNVFNVTENAMLSTVFDEKTYFLYRNANTKYGNPLCRMYVDKNGQVDYAPFYVYEVTVEDQVQTQTIAPTNATWAGDQINGYYITGTLSEPGDLEIILNDYSSFGMGWIMNMNIGGEDLELEWVALEDAPVISEDKVLTLKTTVEGYTLDITATCKAPIEISVTDATMAFSEEEWNAGALIISGTWQNEPVAASIYGWNFYGYNDYTDIQFNVGEDGELMWTNIDASIKKQDDGSALLTSEFSYYSYSGTIDNYVLSIVIAEPIEPALEVIEVSANDMKFENKIFDEGTEWEWMQTTLTATCELGTISIVLDLSLAGTTPENPYGEYGWGIVDNPMMGPMHVSTVDVRITPEAGEDEYVPEIYLSLKEGTVATYTAGEDVDTFIGEFVSETYVLYTFHLTGAKQVSAVENITTTVVPVKVIENGQLIIIKNGVKYNVAGAVVK